MPPRENQNYPQNSYQPPQPQQELPPAPEPNIAPPVPLPYTPPPTPTPPPQVIPPSLPAAPAPPPAQPKPPTLQQYAALDRYGAAGFARYASPQLQAYAPTYAPQAQPQAAQPKKGSATKAVIISLLLLVLLGGMGAGGYLYYRSIQVTPAERFDKAVANDLSAKFIEQHYMFTTNIPHATVNVDLQGASDFSDPANPKTSGSYTTSVKTDTGQSGGTAKADFVMPNKDDFYIRYSEVPQQDSTIPKSAIGKWVKLDTTASRMLFDPLSIAGNLNTPLGEMITGNFKDPLRSNILQRIHSGSIYTIVNTSPDNLNGHDAIKYNAKLDSAKVSELNDYTAQQLKLDSPITSDYFDGTAFTTWVDKADDQFLRVELKQQSVVLTIDYSTPSSAPHTAAPSDFVNASTLMQ